ncbi:hypothetical protein NLG97_g2702 [Lecanicillium saksenae]|uniref:Uncharacterized protein n=1 Tax=Lecanicillium saksenae TaxID=468837 RepID=A0ACC1R3J7_9HYPO|nr:hypothetical protein NLG97_g2702 [Lecanicillium saksenae]
MAPSDTEQLVGQRSAATPDSFPEWTLEDDSDVDIASIAERQRVRFRAASVAGRQRYQSPPRDAPSTLTHRDVSQEAHEIRAILQGRRLGDIGKGLGAATSTLVKGGAEAIGAAAQGIANSGGAAASAFANGGGVGGAAAAAAGSVANGFGKGANAAAVAVAGAGGAFATAVAGSDTSDDDKKTKTKPPKKDPPPQTQDPPPPAQTNDPPQVTEAPPPPPRPSSPPPKQSQDPPSQPPPSSGKKDPDPPKTSDKPIDNVPPPKAEQPSSKPSNTSPDSSLSSDKGSPDASPTPTGDDQKLSLSTLVPGATVTSQSGTRLLLTPVISSGLPIITSGAKDGTTDDYYGSTTPFAVAPGLSTMITSVSPTLGPGAGQSGKPSSDKESKGKDGNGNGSHNGLSPSGQSALISMGVLVGVCALFAIGFYFWRRRKQQMDPTYGSGSSFNSRSLFRGPFDKAKRGLSNIASRIPYIRDRFSGKDRWENIDDPYGDFFGEKRIISVTHASDVPPPPPFKEKLEPITVQTTFTQRSSVVSQFNSTAGIGGTVSSVGVSTMAAPTLGISPIAEVAARASAMGPSAVGGSLVAASAQSSKPIQTSPFEVPGDMPEKAPARPPPHIASQARQLVGVGTNHGPKPSFSSITPQYNLTLPSTFGARRISDLSSLSSGFGDGDIVVPSKNARKSTASGNDQNPTRKFGENERNRISTATTATAKSNVSGRRDTVYTEASEDSPPRFRTVNSWVRQQSGRVKREKQREEDEANESGTPPPVPAIPPEQEFRLMMPDGEEPRRVEDTTTNTDDWGTQTNSMLEGVIGTAH